MKLDYVFLADAGFAQLDTGQFSVLNGGINLVRCAQFPGGLHSLVLVGRLSFEPSECNRKHLIDVEIADPAGSPLELCFRNVEILPEPSALGADRPSLMTLLLTFQSLVFPMPGTYTFRILRSQERDLIGQTTIDAILK